MASNELTTQENRVQVSRDVGFTKKRRQMFLNFLAETGGQIKESARLVGYESPEALYIARKKDPQFAAAWDEALQRAGDVLEAEAVRRAKDGIVKDVYYKGEVVGQERVFSDGLMAKLLDGAKPDKYQKKITKHEGEVNVKVGIAVLPMQAPSLEDWERDSIDQHQRTEAIDGEFIEVASALEKQPEPEASMSRKIVRV